jgi:P4 family phage/plasmid primase-like protien
VDATVWDTDLMVLGTPAGTIDLKTGKLRTASPDDYITKQTSVAPESGEPERWLTFLRESLGDNEDTIRFLQQWCGYCLTGLTNEHALFFIYGPGGNGKSVFLNTIAAIMGDYAVTAAMETFTVSKFDRHPTELAMLAGARMVTASETEEGRAWAEAKVKQMTGGDPITAHFMRKDNFTFRPQFKLTIAGNHAPALLNVDDAMKRRFNIVPFTVKPAKPDRQLEEKLRAEHGKILAWAIKGCLDWLDRGLVRPAPVTEATADYFESQDLFGQWVAEDCETGPEKWESPTPLYNAWCAYSREAGEDPGTMKLFTQNLQKRGYPSKRTGQKGRFYDGIALPKKAASPHHSDGSDAW